MKVLINIDSVSYETLDCFVGDNYNFLFFDKIPDVQRKPFSTYELFDIENLDNDEILYYQGNKLDIILNNFIWFSRISEKDCSCVVSDSKDLYYFKNSDIFKDFLDNKEIDLDKFDNNKEIKKINQSVVFHPHWGWTDFVISVSLVNYYKEVFDEVVILVFDQFVDFISYLFPDTKIVSCTNICTSSKSIDGEILIKDLYMKDYIFLIDGHQSSQCLPLNLNEIVKNPETKNQKLNHLLLSNTIFNQSYNSRGLIFKIKDLDLNHPTFDERVGFYTLSYFDESDIIKYFNIVRNEELENEKYKQYNLEDYIVVNHISGMREDMFEGKNVFQLNFKSDLILDMLKIIEDSNEVHIYDSLYGTLIYFMYFKLDFFKNKKIYYHRYARKKIHKFYNQDLIKSSPDWIIID